MVPHRSLLRELRDRDLPSGIETCRMKKGACQVSNGIVQKERGSTTNVAHHRVMSKMVKGMSARAERGSDVLVTARDGAGRDCRYAKAPTEGNEEMRVIEALRNAAYCVTEPFPIASTPTAQDAGSVSRRAAGKNRMQSSRCTKANKAAIGLGDRDSEVSLNVDGSA